MPLRAANMKPTPDQIHKVATAIANSIIMRNGSPSISNVLEMLPPKLRGYAVEEAEAALDALELVDQRSSPGPVKLEWKWVPGYLTYEARVPAKDANGDGFVIFYAMQRPDYCDRGKWTMLVETEGVFALDDQEGFSRYFFRIENLMEEMELWANERKCILAAIEGS